MCDVNLRVTLRRLFGHYVYRIRHQEGCLDIFAEHTLMHYKYIKTDEGNSISEKA